LTTAQLPATTAWSACSTLVKRASARFILSAFFLPSEPISDCSESLIGDFFLRSFDVNRFSVVSLPPTIHQSTTQSNNQSIYQSINRSIDQSINRLWFTQVGSNTGENSLQ